MTFYCPTVSMVVTFFLCNEHYHDINEGPTVSISLHICHFRAAYLHRLQTLLSFISQNLLSTVFTFTFKS